MSDRVGQVWSMRTSSVAHADAEIVALIVGWDERRQAHRALDLGRGREFLAGDLCFDRDPWWRRIA